MCQPDGFEERGFGGVCRLKKIAIWTNLGTPDICGHEKQSSYELFIYQRTQA